MSLSRPPAALLIAHKVADYDAWKRAFDRHTPARKQASVLGHDVNRGLDDSEMVYIYCPVTDIEKAQAFVASADTDGVMKDAGVVGPPMVKFMKPMSVDYIENHKGAAMIVIHGVENYEAWRNVYDEIDGFRRQCGIVGHAVNQEWGRANQVIIYHQANDRAALQKFIDSSELKEAMQRGGVSGPPDVHFIQLVDVAEY